MRPKKRQRENCSPRTVSTRLTRKRKEIFHYSDSDSEVDEQHVQPKLDCIICLTPLNNMTTQCQTRPFTSSVNQLQKLIRLFELDEKFILGEEIRHLDNNSQLFCRPCYERVTLVENVFDELNILRIKMKTLKSEIGKLMINSDAVMKNSQVKQSFKQSRTMPIRQRILKWALILEGTSIETPNKEGILRKSSTNDELPPQHSRKLEAPRKKVRQSVPINDENSDDIMNSESCYNENEEFTVKEEPKSDEEFFPNEQSFSPNEDKMEFFSNDKDVSTVSCQICNQNCEDGTELLNHQLLEHFELTQAYGFLQSGEINDQTLYYCTQCNDRNFSCLRSYKDHYREFHTELGNLRCNKCDGKMFSSVEGLNFHKKSFHKSKGLSGKVSCNLCGVLIKRQELELHKKKFHDIKKFRCHICRKTSDSESELNIHMKSHERKVEESDTEDSDYQENDILMSDSNEIITVKDEKLSYDETYNNDIEYADEDDMTPSQERSQKKSCKFCDSSFNDDSDLLNHQLEKHFQLSHAAQLLQMDEINGKSVFKCNQCNKGFSSSEGFSVHYKLMHLEIEAFKCSECDKEFSSIISFEHHKKYFHVERKVGKTSKKIITNPKMKKQDSLNTNSKSHQLIIEEDEEESIETHNCNLCEKSFLSEVSLKMHLKIFHTVSFNNTRLLKSLMKESTQMTDFTDPESNGDTEDEFEPFDRKRKGKSLKKASCEFCSALVEEGSRMLMHRLAKHFEHTEANEFLKKKYVEINGLMKEMFCCKQCDNHEYSNLTNYKSHYRLKHSDLTCYKCNTCDRRFAGISGFQYHIKYIHNEKAKNKLPCDLCGQFFHIRKLQAHKDLAHPGENSDIHTCAICGVCLSSKFALKVHLNRHEEISIKEKKNDSNTNKKADLESDSDETDLEKDSSDESIDANDGDETSNYNQITTDEDTKGKTPCQYCQKYFNPYEMNSHIYRRHFGITAAFQNLETKIENGKELYYCKCCVTKRFTDIRNYKYHYQAAHTVEGCEKKKCKECDKKFASSFGLSSHMKKFHSAEGQIKIPCEICGKLYSSYSLESHKKLKHGNEPLEKFQCEICNRIYSSKFMLVRHLKCHEGNTFLCPICGKSFTSEFKLKSHDLEVHGTRLPCNQCERTFGKNYLLKKHIDYVHNNIPRPRPYLCSMCPKTFRQKQRLNTHLERHFRN